MTIIDARSFHWGLSTLCAIVLVTGLIAMPGYASAEGTLTAAFKKEYALLEAEKIKAKIMNMEHDLWSY